MGLSETLIKLGHEVEVVTSRYSRMPEIEKIKGIKVTRLPQWANMYNTPVVTAIRSFVRRSHADVVHVHSPPPFTERFAAKEAFSKAVGTGFRRGVFMKDIGVVNAKSGAPTLSLTGGAAIVLAEMVPEGHEARIHLTLTDDHPWAQAYVIIEALPK
jgi:holo-[acyl-carrier-protein] synthase